MGNLYSFRGNFKGKHKWLMVLVLAVHYDSWLRLAERLSLEISCWYIQKQNVMRKCNVKIHLLIQSLAAFQMPLSRHI